MAEPTIDPEQLETTLAWSELFIHRWIEETSRAGVLQPGQHIDLLRGWAFTLFNELLPRLQQPPASPKPTHRNHGLRCVGGAEDDSEQRTA
jgi:hypothetical protein